MPGGERRRGKRKGAGKTYSFNSKIINRVFKYKREKKRNNLVLLAQLEGDNSATCRIFCKTKNSAKCRMFYQIRKLQNAKSWQNVCNFLIW